MPKPSLPSSKIKSQRGKLYWFIMISPSPIFILRHLVPVMPRVVPVRSGTRFAGEDWIGLRMRDVSVVRGIGVLPIFAGLIGLLLLVGSLAATWAREGR